MKNIFQDLEEELNNNLFLYIITITRFIYTAQQI